MMDVTSVTKNMDFFILFHEEGDVYDATWDF